MSTEELGSVLLVLARNAIARRLGLPEAPAPDTDLPELDRPGATFVTLTQQGELRGCIGSLEAHRPLRDDVRENALAAAFRDPRFPPLERKELALSRVEVSLLTAPQPMPVADEADALARICPGVDGLIFQVGHLRATFLPQVWEQLPTPRQFLCHLKMKAGLPADFWSPGVRLSRYGVQKWKEPQA
ncbi:MAG: AmmeMemoRadiSam system protein A [Rhodocyclaceae bacterium]|nr:AmmeMemoRadiSam system protein A [Rhodocyclaceae bacterium]